VWRAGVSRDDPRAEEEAGSSDIARPSREPPPLTVAGPARVTTSGPAIRTLLAHAIDYAGLFPPAALPMREATREYALYRESNHAWALGPFVVPVARIDEFYECARSLLEPAGSPWRLRAVSPSLDDVTRVARSSGAGALVDAIELRVRTPADVRAAASTLPKDLVAFYEIPIDDDPDPLVAAIARVGGRAKVRTGGTTEAVFPAAPDLARFIVACARAAVPFKATAGLHHALRGEYRLTYEPDSPRSEMFGFLNLLLAAAFAAVGLGPTDVVEVLTEANRSAFRFEKDGVTWRGRHMPIDSLAETRAILALSFGSCSFNEPIDELKALGLL
jgi:hypothetical protein